VTAAGRSRGVGSHVPMVLLAGRADGRDAQAAHSIPSPAMRPAVIGVRDAAGTAPA